MSQPASELVARTRRLLLVGLAAITLAGCSQTAALAPVGGNRLTIIRFAANDVLVKQDVDLLIAPVCAADGRDVTCHGSSVQGAPILVTSNTDDQAEMTVTVGGATIYAGSVQDVIDAGARP